MSCALLTFPEMKTGYSIPSFEKNQTAIACLPYAYADDDLAGELATVTGWGKLSDDTNSGSIAPFYARDRPIISNADCASIYGPSINEQSLCIDTRAADGVSGVCNGDSGGPLNLQVGEGE